MSSASPLLEDLDLSKATTTMSLRVRFAETDMMGIVHHASYIVYFEAGRVEWLRRRGITHAGWAGRAIQLPVVEAHAQYRAPARFDDLIDVETTLTELRTVSLKFSYRLLREGSLLAEGWTRLACVDENHKLARMTDDMRAVMLRGETVPVASAP